MAEYVEDQNAIVPVQETTVLNGEIVDDNNLRREYVQKIGASWQKSIDAIFETGFLLIEAKERIGHGKFVVMIGTDLPFSDATAQKLMRIAGDQRLLDLARSAKALHAPESQQLENVYFHVTPARVLPASWGTLYELTRLSDDQFKFALEAGKIHSHLERKDAIKLKSLPTGRADMNVRDVKQPPRKGKSDSAPKTDAQEHIKQWSVTLTPAEVMILDLLLTEGVNFGKVQSWVTQNWPADGQPKLQTAPLDVEELKTKLATAVKALGL